MMTGQLAREARQPVPAKWRQGGGMVFPLSVVERDGERQETSIHRSPESAFANALQIAHQTISSAAGRRGEEVFVGARSLSEVAATSAVSLASSAVRLRSSLSDVFGHYAISDPVEIESFLVAHPELPQLLSAAPAAIRRIYGDCTLKLETLVEPEENWVRLFLVIRVSLPVDEIIARADRLRDDWVLPNIDKFGPDFSIVEEPA